jgi:hypothetical protein
MDSIPTYLSLTAYGERISLQKAGLDGLDSCSSANLSSLPYQANGRTPTRRIFNRLAAVQNFATSSSSDDNSIDTKTVPASTVPYSELVPGLRNLQSNWPNSISNVSNFSGTALSVPTPSTLPGFRDEGLLRSQADILAHSVLGSRTDTPTPSLPCPVSYNLETDDDDVDIDYENNDDDEDDDDEVDDEDGDDDGDDAAIYQSPDRIRFRPGLNNFQRYGTGSRLTETNQPIPEIPRTWTKRDSNTIVTTLQGNKGVEVRADLNVHESNKEFSWLRGNVPIPQLCGIYYYEVTFDHCLRETVIGVGFCHSKTTLTRLPGLDQLSWGYHSDDGRTASNPGHNQQFGPPFGMHDTIGCGFDFSTNTMFFTKNGLLLGTNLTKASGYALDVLEPQYCELLYPCVGFKSCLSFRTNFGGQRFVYDIDQHVRNKKKQLFSEIRKISGLPQRSFWADNERNVPDFMRQLLLSYFSYLGYTDTYKFFDEETKKQQQTINREAPQTTPADTTWESKLRVFESRQLIRTLITVGKIDEAILLLKEHYPKILDENDSIIMLKLQCCKFIELVRATIPGRLDDPLSTAGDGTLDLPAKEDAAYTKLVQFGQSLRDTYKNDTRPEVQERLAQCFSLLAYEDPRQDSSVAFLLSERERQNLAEEVISKIMVSLDQPAEPELTRVANYTMALAHVLQSQKVGDATLLNAHRDFL